MGNKTILTILMKEVDNQKSTIQFHWIMDYWLEIYNPISLKKEIGL